MSRVNVYLPDELAAQAKQAGLNVSSLTQEAIRAALAAESVKTWLTRVAELTSPGVDHESVMSAVRAARDDLGG